MNKLFQMHHRNINTTLKTREEKRCNTIQSDSTFWIKSDTHIGGFKDFLFSAESYDTLEKTTQQLKPQVGSPKCPLGPSKVCACVCVRLWEGHRR